MKDLIERLEDHRLDEGSISFDSEIGSVYGFLVAAHARAFDFVGRPEMNGLMNAINKALSEAHKVKGLGKITDNDGRTGRKMANTLEI